MKGRRLRVKRRLKNEHKKKIIFVALFFSLLLEILPNLSQHVSGIISDRETILWWHPSGSPSLTVQMLATWAKTHNITSVASYPLIGDTNRTYLQSQGLKVYNIVIPSQDEPPADYNYTDIMVNYRDVSLAYDGIILDDTQNLWEGAHKGAYDDLTNMQSFLYYANQILTPAFSPNNIIAEMAIYGDAQNITEMTQLNSSIVFSYYYAPDPLIKYYRSGNYFNTSANAWEITDWYDAFGLNSYTKYDGWLWLNKDVYPNINMLSTKTIYNTTNAVLNFADNYRVKNLHIYAIPDFYGNTRLEYDVGKAAGAFLYGETLDTSEMNEENLNSYYWDEDFSTTPSNQTPINYTGWQITRTTSNYSYSSMSGNLNISHSGIDAGWNDITFARLTGSGELGLNVHASFTPVRNESWKRVVLEGTYPYPYAYEVSFDQGQEQNIRFVYRNSTVQDVTTYIANWTSDTAYDITFWLSEEHVVLRIENSSWSWVTYVTNGLFYNSLKIYAILLIDLIADNSATFTSQLIDHVHLDGARDPANLEVDITDRGPENYVFAETKYYTFAAKYWDGDGYTDLSIMKIAFTDGAHWINASYSTTAGGSLDLGSDEVNLQTDTTIIDSNVLQINFKLYFKSTILDAQDISIFMYCIDESSSIDGWERIETNYFNIYNYGGATQITTSGNAGRLQKQGPFDVYAYNNSWVMITTEYQALQHAKLIPMLEWSTNIVGANTRLMYFMDYQLEGSDTWYPGWALQLRGFYGTLTSSSRQTWTSVAFWWGGTNNTFGLPATRATSWSEILTSSPYNLYLLRDEEDIFSFCQIPSTSSRLNLSDVGYKTQWFIDLWYDQTNASSYGGARVNAYQYYMFNSVSPWWQWLSGVAWGPVENYQKEMSILAPLVDEDSHTLYASDIKMTRLGVFLENQYTSGSGYAQVTHGEEVDLTIGSAPLKGIAKPTFEPTTIPIMPQGGGLFGTIWTALQSIFRSLSDIFGPAILNAWNVFVAFLDTVFGLFGWHNGFSQILSIITSFLTWVITSVGLLIQILITVFLFIVSVFTSMVTYFISFFQGLTTIYGMLVYIWDSVFPYWGWIPGVLYQLLPFLFLLAALWIVSPFFEKRSFSAGMAGTRDRLDLTVGWIWKGAMFLWRIIDFVLDTIYRLIEEVPVVE